MVSPKNFKSNELLKKKLRTQNTKVEEIEGQKYYNHFLLKEISWEERERNEKFQNGVCTDTEPAQPRQHTTGEKELLQFHH